MEKMKAVVCTAYGAPEVLQITTVDKPVPKSNEILVKIKATTVTAADFRLRSFTVPAGFWIPARLALGIFKPRNPILGVELAGVIEEVGNSVTRFKKGDRVFAATLSKFGGYATYNTLPEDGPIAKIPEGISFESAAAIPVGARTALHFLRKTKIGKGQRILIYGASGSVGTYAVQLAKYFGAHVTGVCSTGNVELVNSLGADEVIDYTTVNWDNLNQRFDIVFLAIDKLSFDVCLRLLTTTGIYVNITAPFKTLPMIFKRGGRTIIMAENSTESAEDLVFLGSLAETKALVPVIDRTYALDQIVEAHHYVDRGHKKGNVVVTVS